MTFECTDEAFHHIRKIFIVLPGMLIFLSRKFNITHLSVTFLPLQINGKTGEIFPQNIFHYNENSIEITCSNL